MRNDGYLKGFFLKKTSMAGIARAVSISKIWLHFYVEKKRDAMRNHDFQISRKGKVFIEDDVMPEKELPPYATPFLKTTKGTEYFLRTACHAEAFPAGKRGAADKESGETSHVERINLTFRQILSA